jgi:hypothetical protein
MPASMAARLPSERLDRNLSLRPSANTGFASTDNPSEESHANPPSAQKTHSLRKTLQRAVNPYRADHQRDSVAIRSSERQVGKLHWQVASNPSNNPIPLAWLVTGEVLTRTFPVWAE